MKDHFLSLELVFDTFSPFYVWANNHRVTLTRIGAATHWALRRGKELENWAEGIRLLDECIPSFAQDRDLAHIRWVRFIPLLSKTTGIFHYRLG